MNDADLIRLWKAGHQSAATALVERHSSSLHNMALRSGVCDEVDELVQDVFVRAFGAIDSYRGDKASFLTWLVAIMRRLILDRARVSRRAQILAPLDTADSQPARESNALDRVIASETLTALLASLDNADDVRLVRMRLAGYRWRSIAKALGRKEPSIKVRYHRLRLAMIGALAA